MNFKHIIVIVAILAVGYFVGAKYPSLVSSTIAKVA